MEDSCDDGWMELMRRGDFSAAWRLSDRALRRRPPADERTPRHEQRIWDGTPLAGRRVLVRCYHGLGDTIQFVRYLPLVSSIATQVSVWIQRPLIELLSSTPCMGTLFELHEGVPDADFDVDVEIMELPHVFRTTEATIPGEVPYIRVEPSCVTDGEGLRVGVAWTSGGWNPRRSVCFEALVPVLDVRAITFTALQAIEPREHAARFLPNRPVAPIATLAREIAVQDLVISVDTMTAHLAGALGRPTWLLLPFECDWRWMRERSDSPWYPTMRIYRQPSPGDWTSVMDAVRRDLTRCSRERTRSARSGSHPPDPAEAGAES